MGAGFSWQWLKSSELQNENCKLKISSYAISAEQRAARETNHSHCPDRSHLNFQFTFCNFHFQFPYRTAPPLALMTWPVMYAAWSLARNRASRATSSGVPQRARGVSRMTRSCHTADACSPHAVRIQPGAMQFTRTVGARLTASDREKLMMALFAAANNSPLS